MILDDSKVQLQVTIGRMYWNTMRDLIDQIKLRGIPVEYEESSGFFDKTFTIYSDVETVVVLDKLVKNWANNSRDS